MPKQQERTASVECRLVSGDLLGVFNVDFSQTVDGFLQEIVLCQQGKSSALECPASFLHVIRDKDDSDEDDEDARLKRDKSLLEQLLLRRGTGGPHCGTISRRRTAR